MAAVADAALLEAVDEEALEALLRARWEAGAVYTYAGDAVLAVNPCRPLPLYSAEAARRYAGAAPHALPPHVYAAAADAWRRARDTRRPQCVVATGESGAGKTEAARLCLQAVLVAAPPAPRLLASLPAAGTLLEAFGNAATARNHNASRFGKLLEIELDFGGVPRAAHLTHYLLEKDRASGAPAGERNFHVLYQLLAGADGPLLRRLRLRRAPERYRILRAAPASPRRAPPGAPPDPAPQDRAHFAHTMRAMRALGLDERERDAVLRALAFALKLGNVAFEPQPDVDGSLATRLRREHELREACELVGADAAELGSALLAPHDADRGGGEWARGALERLVRELYARLFAWLVGRANAALAGEGPAAERARLALVDVYGLEALAANGAPRLAINYAAERVQAAVTAATLRREQEEYAREGLAWRPLAFRDTEPLAAAIERLVLAPLAAAGPLLPALAAAAAAQPALAPHLRLAPPHAFRVEHFGGWVEYDAALVEAGARDAACGRCSRALRAASEPLFGELFGGAGRAAPAPPLSAQRALVDALVRRVGRGAPRLVRCLRADARLRPRRWDAALVRAQLAQQGLAALARLRRAGWAHAESARELLARHGPPWRWPAAGEPVASARALLARLPLPPAEFAFGRTRVFVRSPRTVWELEALRAARVRVLVVRVQRAWRARRARVAAARTLARWWASAARARYLRELARALPPQHRSPACDAWPAARWPALVGGAHARLRALHHAWRCRAYRARFDRAARNRMREKVTASALFRGRKASYARSVGPPFVGDYVRLRASAAWRRSARAEDAFVVFADAARAEGGGGGCVVALSTAALLVLEARGLRERRRVDARGVRALLLSPLADDLVAVLVAEEPAAEGACLTPARRRSDVLLRTPHALELATKLFLVVQNAAGAAPRVDVAPEFSLRLGGAETCVVFHEVCGAGGVRVVRGARRIDVLVDAPRS